MELLCSGSWVAASETPNPKPRETPGVPLMRCGAFGFGCGNEVEAFSRFGVALRCFQFGPLGLRL